MFSAVQDVPVMSQIEISYRNRRDDDLGWARRIHRSNSVRVTVSASSVCSVSLGGVYWAHADQIAAPTPAAVRCEKQRAFITRCWVTSEQGSGGESWNATISVNEKMDRYEPHSNTAKARRRAPRTQRGVSIERRRPTGCRTYR